MNEGNISVSPHSDTPGPHDVFLKAGVQSLVALHPAKAAVSQGSTGDKSSALTRMLCSFKSEVDYNEEE